MSIADKLPRDVVAEKKAAKGPASVSETSPFTTANALSTADVCDRLGIEHDDKFATCPGCKEPGAAIALDVRGLKCLHDRCSRKGKNGGFRTNVDLVAEVKSLSAVGALNWLAEQFSFEGVRAKTVVAPPPEDEAAPTARIVWIPASDLALPLPPTPWRVRGIQLCPGRPAMVAAYGSSGKTLTCQDLALAYAASVAVWHQFATAPDGVARHFDHEQGRHPTTRRYQRLARGRGIDLAALGHRLAVSCFPDIYLNMAGAEDAYAAECEGVHIAVIDALRGATPGADENDSKIRYCIDNLTRVSEKTGTAFVIIHHAGKPKDGHADARTIARGSSAIFDACGCVLVMVGEKGAPKLVSQQKTPAEAEGGGIEDFYLSIEDVPDATSTTAGVRVVYRAVEQVNAPKRSNGKFDQLKADIITVVRSARDLSSLNAICARVTGGGKDTKIEAIRELLRDGALTQPGGEGSPFRVVS